jgi:hypothetical protein
MDTTPATETTATPADEKKADDTTPATDDTAKTDETPKAV